MCIECMGIMVKREYIRVEYVFLVCFLRFVRFV